MTCQGRDKIYEAIIFSCQGMSMKILAVAPHLVLNTNIIFWISLCSHDGYDTVVYEHG